MDISAHAQHMPLPRGTILIVDDNPDNLGFLFDYFVELGYRVLVALDGKDALDQIEQARPDIILLDAMMPELDGFETCKRLKQRPETRDIPVIFMSALSSPDDKLRGFEMGAVDYVTKPVHKEEVQARVRSHISLMSLQRELEQRNSELQEFGHMVAHDLRDPLTTVIARTELILDEWDEHGASAPAGVLRDLEAVRDAGRHMDQTIAALLTLAGLSHERATPRALDMKEIVEEACHGLREAILAAGARVTSPAEWPAALGHAAWIKQVWCNYISNGLKYGGRPPALALGADQEQAGMIRFWVRDNGVGLPDEPTDRMFAPFTRFHPDRARGHGLGLSIVERIISRLGGSVGARRLEHGGSEFSFTLPRA